MPVQTVIKVRRDTAANWISTNPILAAGEMGLETDTDLFKFGNGTATWTALAYSSSSRTTQIAKNDTGGSVTKGQVAYISGANGANALFLLADADSEATSSKTVGLLAQGLATNGIGAIVTEGLLSGVNTGTATAGQSVWLSGTAGGFVFGAPPAKPTHSVYLGVVTRAHATEGEILVKVQNGYELNELHDLDITSPVNNQVLKYDSASGLWENKPELEIEQTVTSASTKQLTVASPRAQHFTGTTASQILLMPDTATLAVGDYFLVTNSSSQTVAVKSSTSVSLGGVATGVNARYTCISIADNTAASWRVSYEGSAYITGNGALVYANQPTINLGVGGTSAGSLGYSTNSGNAYLLVGTGSGTSSIESTAANDTRYARLGSTTNTFANALNTFSGNVSMTGTNVNVTNNLNSNGTLHTKPIAETVNLSMSAFAGYTFDVKTSAIAYTLVQSSNNGVVNIRGDGSTTLSSMLAVGEAMTVTLLVYNGATARYVSGVQIDGTTTNVTTVYLGGTAPTGNANAVDAYTFTIIKMTSTPSYTIFASVSKFA